MKEGCGIVGGFNCFDYFALALGGGAMAAGPGSQQGDAIPPAPQELATAHALARRISNGSGVCLYFTKNSHKRYEISSITRASRFVRWNQRQRTTERVARE